MEKYEDNSQCPQSNEEQLIMQFCNACLAVAPFSSFVRPGNNWLKYWPQKELNELEKRTFL